jgi:hypothetical protein
MEQDFIQEKNVSMTFNPLAILVRQMDKGLEQVEDLQKSTLFQPQLGQQWRRSDLPPAHARIIPREKRKTNQGIAHHFQTVLLTLLCQSDP